MLLQPKLLSSCQDTEFLHCPAALELWLADLMQSVITDTLNMHANQNVLQPVKKLSEIFFSHMIYP